MIDLRKATPANIPGIAAIVRDVWGQDILPDVCQAQTRCQACALYVAAEGDDVAGFVSAFLTLDKDGNRRWEIARDQRHFRFESEALIEQLDFYIRLLDEVGELGYTIEDVRVSLTALDERRIDTLQANVVDPLAAKHPDVKVGFDQHRQSGRGYYAEACFRIDAQSSEGLDLLLVDGGFTTWTQQLLSNRKERLLTSGIGSERLCACFRASD
ncbi:MAG: hypothetical protein ACE5R4_18225 [Armatimonadota bacterium]